MPPKQKIPTAKNMKAVKEQNGFLQQLTSPTALAGIVIAVLLLGIVMAFTGPDGDGIVRTSELRNFEGMLKRIGVRRRFSDIMCNATSRTISSQGCYSYVRTQVPRGETVMKIPQELVLDVRSIMGREEYRQLLGREENSTLDSFVKSANLEQAYYFYIYAHFLVAERNKGSGSEYAEWIAMLPKDDDMLTGLQWSPADDECLDEATANELGYFRQLLDGMVKVGEYVCQGGRCAPFQYEDLRWGITIYRSRSLQDQALVIPMDFVNHAQEANIAVEWNQEDKTLDVKLMANVNKGDELLTHYGYGKTPMSLLVSHGFVEDTTSFYPANVNMDVDKVPLLKKLNCDRKYEIGYHASGKPRALFLTCLTALVMNEEQRGRFKTLTAPAGQATLEGLEIAMYTYGNLTYGIQTAAQKSRPSQEQIAKCSDRNTPALALVERMQRQTMEFLIKSHKHCSELYERAKTKFVAAGGEIAKPDSQQQQSSGATTVNTDEATADSP